MPSASQLRIAIEHQLSQRIPAALTPAPRLSSSYVVTGIPALDGLLEGLPVGAMTEATGAAGSGRTALAMATVASAMQAGQIAAWVDVTCAFHPEVASANGVLLDRLLWVRCERQSIATSSPVPNAGAACEVPSISRVQHGGGSPHPRSEERGLPEAVNALLSSTGKYRRDRVTGTPGAPNRQLQQTSSPRSKLSARIEQAGTDRQPSRRGSYVLQQRERFNSSQVSVETASASRLYEQRFQMSKPWRRIDQALRVTDLLLQAGGFRVVILDLADIPAEFVSRVPMATWFRFRAGAERAQCALLVLTQHPCTGSSAGLLLRMQGQGELEQTTFFPGLRFGVEIGRQRFPSPTVIPLRKPPTSVTAAEWNAVTPWAGQR